MATQATHLERTPEVEPTSGNLHEPVDAGRGVHGHLKETLAAEAEAEAAAEAARH